MPVSSPAHRVLHKYVSSWNDFEPLFFLGGGKGMGVEMILKIEFLFHKLWHCL